MFTGSHEYRGSLVPFWFVKLFIEVFGLNFASLKSLLQSVKILSIMKPLLWHWDCSLNVFMSSKLSCFIVSWLLRLKEAPCKHICKVYSPAIRLLLLWYHAVCQADGGFSHSFAFLTACTCPHPVLGIRGCPCAGCLCPENPLLKSGHAGHGSLRQMSGTFKENLSSGNGFLDLDLTVRAPDIYIYNSLPSSLGQTVGFLPFYF